MDFEEWEDFDLAIKIICDYFDEFIKKYYDKFLCWLDIMNDYLKVVIEEIIKFNFKLVSGFFSGGNSWVN